FDLAFTGSGAASTRTFDVADGAAAIDLDVPAALSNTVALATILKIGTGTMQLSGGAQSTNSFGGTFIAREGTLILNKSNNTNGIINGNATITGTALTVADASTVTGATVRYGDDNQIKNTTTVTINPLGTL